MTLVLIAAGGAVGGMLRYSTSVLIVSDSGSWPAATFVVNIVGCLIMGLFLGRVALLESVSPRVTALFATGFLGGLTTFSTFAAEVALLTRNGAAGLAALYAAVSVLAGVLAVRAGWWFAQRGALR